MTPEAPIVGLVLHFRTPERTLACLRSLLDDGVHDVVVVDNSEDDGRSLEGMATGLGALRSAGLRPTLLRPQRNLGFAGGVALGLEHLGQPAPAHVLLINSDARLEPGACAAMRRALGAAACVVPRSRRDRTDPPVSSIVFYQALFALYLRRPRLRAFSYPSGCCMLIRQSEARPGLLDRDFFFYGEDVMLGFDLARRGLGVTECAAATVLHAGSASARNGSMFYEYHMVRAHWLLAGKLGRSRWERLAFGVARAFTLPLRALLRSVRAASLTPWRGLFAATADVMRRQCRSFTPPASR